MQIKTADGEKSVSSAGVGGTGLGLGIAGTALGLLNAGNNGCGCNNGGLFGGLFGGNNCGCNSCGHTDHDSRVISGLEAQIAALSAEKYSDNSDLKLFEDYSTRIANEKDRTNDNFRTIYQELVASRERLQSEVCRLDKETALNKQASDYQYAILDGKIKNSAEGVQNWVLMQNYISGKVVMPIDKICPQPLPACVPVALDPQTIATTPVTNVGVINANATRASVAQASK